MKSSVLFLIFNRPTTTREVFSAISFAKPPRLYIAADGPRANRLGEAERCAEVRRIATAVDWPCEVKTLFRDENLGCKWAPCSSISWFFEQETEGIILEDDCLPSNSFFSYCDELLEYYRDDTRIWQICGTNMFGRDPDSAAQATYRFSKYGPVWGWASWRRAWQHYDPELLGWPQMSRPEMMESAYETEVEQKVRFALGTRLFSQEIDTAWDFQWGIAKNFNSGLSIIPSNNLIKNIGFGPDATHTIELKNNLPQEIHELPATLIHPQFVLPEHRHDANFLKLFLPLKRNIFKRVINKINSFIS